MAAAAAAAVAGGGDGDPPPRQRLTIAFIGAKGVGKTSIIKQFVSNEYSDVVCSTERPQRYTTSLVTDANRIIEINISDFPAIDKFPEDSLAEWNIHTKQQQQQQSNGTKCSSAATTNKPPTPIVGPPQSFCRLRQVSAYVLVFDASRPQSTFLYLKQMREQILRHGGPDAYKRPIVVAANKQDLVRPTRTPPRSNKIGAGAQQRASSTEWSCQVRKQWRCHYVECSAKFNWQIIHLFQQAVQAIESRSMNGSDRPGTEGYRGIAGGLHHLHMLHMPHLAQLAVGGLGNLASLPGIMPPAFPLPDPPLPLPPMRQRSSSGTRLRRAVSRCPLS